VSYAEYRERCGISMGYGKAVIAAMFLFRADGNREIGSGHIMRCLSIADAGRKYFNHDSLFVLAEGSFREAIRRRGYRCVVFNTDYRDLEPEAERMGELIRLYVPSVLFVDSYYVSPLYLTALQSAVRAGGGRLVYVDDVMSFAYPCDILVNYNIYGPDERDVYEKLYVRAGIPLPRLVLGTSYVPLREEFQNLGIRAVKKEAETILISTGGADTEHLALHLAEYLAGRKRMSGGDQFAGFRFHFIVGAMNRDYEKIETITRKDEAISLHFNVANMQQLMGEADVAISAAGSTLYELCAAQTPALTYILADNQIPGAKGFERHGILHCAGDVRDMEDIEIPEKLLRGAVELAGDYEGRKAVSAVQRALVDGNGARRIVEAVLTA